MAAPSLAGALLPANVVFHRKTRPHVIPSCTIFWCSYHVSKPVCGSSEPQDRTQQSAAAFHPFALCGFGFATTAQPALIHSNGCGHCEREFNDVLASVNQPLGRAQQKLRHPLQPRIGLAHSRKRGQSRLSAITGGSQRE